MSSSTALQANSPASQWALQHSANATSMAEAIHAFLMSHPGAQQDKFGRITDPAFIPFLNNFYASGGTDPRNPTQGRIDENGNIVDWDDEEDFGSDEPLWQKLGYSSKREWKDAGRPTTPKEGSDFYPTLFAQERAQRLAGIPQGGWTRDASGNTVAAPYAPYGGNQYGSAGWPNGIWNQNPSDATKQALAGQYQTPNSPASGLQTASAASTVGPDQAPLQGGATRDAAGNTFDAAGNPLTYAGVTSPQSSMPADRSALLASLARSTAPDQYGSTPQGGPLAAGSYTLPPDFQQGAGGRSVRDPVTGQRIYVTPQGPVYGEARPSHMPDFSKPALAGDMIDPRNWDPTQYINHPEWGNQDVYSAYQRSQGAFDNRGPYTDPSGGSILPIVSKWYANGSLRGPSDWGKMADGSWGYRNPGESPYEGFGTVPGQYVNDWTRLGFDTKKMWKNAGRPDELQLGELPSMRLPSYNGPAYQNPYGSPSATGSPAGQLPTMPNSSASPLWQQSGLYNDKAAWKQAGRPGLPAMTPPASGSPAMQLPTMPGSNPQANYVSQRQANRAARQAGAGGIQL